MGQRGPQPTPTPILELHGSDQATRRKGEPRPPKPARPPVPPSWLDTEAKAEWRRTVKELDAMGTLAKADRGMLTAYCEAWSEFRLAVKAIREEGHTLITESGYVYLHPMVGVRNKAAERVAKFGAHFGLSPSSRANIKVEPKGDEEEDELQAILARRRNA